MKKGVFIVIILIVLTGTILVSVLRLLNFSKTQEPIKPSINLTKTTMNKTLLMVIAFKDFRDEEYFVPKQIFEENGIKVETVSNKKGLAIGADGGEVEILKTVKEINVNDYDGIVFVGGPGMVKELDNLEFQELAKEFYKKDKLVSAICIAPALLAKAKVLEGKKATVWSSPLDKSAIKILKENGAIYEDQKVVVEGNIITANGPQAAELFAQKIIEYFK